MHSNYKKNDRDHVALRKMEARIDWFTRNKVNHFSPTISPAPKNTELQEIESIGEAIRYYAEKGMSEITVQPKYMGSYCDIYLHQNLQDTYFVSRNGFLINHIDLALAKEKCTDLHQKMANYWAEGAEIIIIQAELMPWRTLGKGLIEEEYHGYWYSHQTHLDFLKNSVAYEQISKAKASEAFLAFEDDYHRLSEKELKEKYKQHIIRQYEALIDLNILQISDYEQDVNLFKTQLDIYDTKTDLYFKPFNILKIIYDDGKETILNDNIKGFASVSDDEQLVLSLENVENAITQAKAFFENLVLEKHEGVMIKARTTFLPNCPPAFKIRNNQYLQMIYGLDFRKDLAQYTAKRTIRQKLECSINDWAISHEMLKIPYRKINEENYLLKLLCYKRIMQEETERGLDTRL